MTLYPHDKYKMDYKLRNF